MRLDIYLVEKKYFATRSRAQNEIKMGHVLVDCKVVKSSFGVTDTSKIEIINKIPYVSRGGLKLEKAIKVFNLDFLDKVVLDIGASTGGFTDCALKFGAKKVYAVDVGSDQLDISLKENPRVVSLENTNILDTNITEKIDFLVMDVSFVSILKLVDCIKKYLNNENKLICLIKPEFEAGNMYKKGVIKSKKMHFDILNKVKMDLNDNDLYINKLDFSPIKGGKGNIEFISLIERKRKNEINIKKVIDNAHNMEG